MTVALGATCCVAATLLADADPAVTIPKTATRTTDMLAVAAAIFRIILLL